MTDNRTHNVITIDISWTAPIYLRMLFVIPALLKPWADIVELICEYFEWGKEGIFPHWWHRALYILDHFIIWYFYCVWAGMTGRARGFKWEIKELE